MKNKKDVLKKWIIFFCFSFIAACDFTPRLERDILKAQNSIQKQNFVKAIRQFEEILQKNCPSNIRVKIYFQLGELYSTHLFDNEKAVYYFKQVLNESSDPMWLYQSLERIAAIEFSFLKNYKECIQKYSQLLAFDPRLPRSDFYEYRLGLSYKNQGDFESAENMFNSIIKIKNHGYAIHSLYELGIVNFKRRNWEQALRYWSLYVKKEKRRDNIVRTIFLMANAYETMEKLKQAYDLYYSILGEYPNTEVIQDRLKSIYSRRIARRR